MNGIFNGGKNLEDLRKSFGADNAEYVNQAITQPMQALHLFGGLRVEEVQNLLKVEPKSQLYPYLHQKYSQASPKNEQALALLEKMDKSDPSQELHRYLLALIPIGKLSSSYQKMKIEDLAEVRAENMKALDFYLKNHPELELNPDKQDVLLEKMKSDQSFLAKDLDQLVLEGFFTKSEQYTTAFEAEVRQLTLPDSEGNTLRKELHLLENNSDLKNFEFKALNTEEILLSFNGQNIRLNVKEKSLDGFVNSAGNKIRFADQAELLRTGIFVLSLKSNNDIWGEIPDYTKPQGNFPFDLADGVSQVWQGPQSIVFRKHDGEKVVMSNLLPYFSEMDVKFPTIESGNNRQFFVSYLNTLWAKEHEK